MLFNLTDGNNGTPLNTTDDVLKNRLYSFSNGRWNIFVNEDELNEKVNNILLNRLIVLVQMKPSGNDLSFVSGDLGSNIRRFIFDSEVNDKLNTFNPTTGEFTALFTGYYLVNMNILQTLGKEFYPKHECQKSASFRFIKCVYWFVSHKWLNRCYFL